MNKSIFSLRLVFVFLFCIFFASAQQGGPHEIDLNDRYKPGTNLRPQSNELDSLITWQERIELQIDKNTTQPQDVLFFKANILTGPKQLRVSASDVLKIELLDEKGELIKTQNHKIQAGISNGSFEIPKKIKPGIYFLRAYTRWMLNYGFEKLPTKKIHIGSFDQNRKDEKIEFYPEGGALVAGLNNRLIMKIHENTVGEIQIIDSQNREVSSVVQYGTDMYSTLFVPEKENTYFLKYNSETKRPLPSIKEYGCTLQVNNIDEDFFDLRIQKSPELLKEKLLVRGRSNGVKLLETEVNFQNKSIIDIQIPKKELASGILSLSIEDELDQVWATRRLHIDNANLQIVVEPLQEETSSEVLTFSLKVTDSDGKPVETDLGVSLLSGNVLDSARDTYSTDNKRSQRFINDLFVLSNQLPQSSGITNSQNFPEEIYYDFQKGLEFYGQAYDLKNVLLENQDMQILITTENDVIVKEIRTDSNGMIELSGLDLEGEATMVFRRIADDTKSKLVKVNPYNFKTPPLKTEVQTQVNRGQKEQKTRMATSRPGLVESGAFSAEGTIALEGVTLVEEKVKRFSTPSVYGVEPYRKVIQDPKRPKTIPQLFLGVPGFNISNIGGLNPSLVVPRSFSIGPVLWVIDGFPLDQSSVRSAGGSQTSALREVMDLISYTDIERIEILRGPSAAIYGSRAAGGVILIYTRNGDDTDYYARKDAQLTFQGYSKSIDFQQYSASSKTKKRNQSLPETLYWNPSLKTDKNGEAVVRINRPDAAKKVELEAIAITPEGKIGKVTQSF